MTPAGQTSRAVLALVLATALLAAPAQAYGYGYSYGGYGSYGGRRLLSTDLSQGADFSQAQLFHSHGRALLATSYGYGSYGYGGYGAGSYGRRRLLSVTDSALPSSRRNLLASYGYGGYGGYGYGY